MESKLLLPTRNLIPFRPPLSRRSKLSYSTVLAVLARPTDSFRNSSKPADIVPGLTGKTVYNDNWFEQLAVNHLSQSVQAVTEMRNSKSGYDGLVQAAVDASRKFSLIEQREIVIQALHKAIPEVILNLIKAVLPQSKFTREYFATFTTLFFAWLVGPCEVRESEFNGTAEKNVVHIKKCRFLEETSCVGMCTNLCKVPTQTFIKNSMGMAVNMVPNFEDMSCEIIFGQDPPALTEDAAFSQPCYKLCKANQKHITKCSS
ncbi:hypothetical protein K2173_018437 [Erythroxylum novogranatense]|uniref:Beta-carotene isomerase D27-like C-terminal domain-containing protein n=1 Tax=Erythroxylum novogranatense TaxID=1862640 RepID=A0AAV8UAM5_9ROSI|nr:hypothetical protein K2173_018437 [Erythroxylum novogranatense]